MNISDKDIKFTLWAAVAALMVMAFFHIFAPRAPSGEVYDTQVQAADPEVLKDTLTGLEYLDADALDALLAPRGGESTFVMIYTSWCPHCRQALPDMLHLRDKGFFKNARVVMISVDQDPKKLANYLSQPSYQDSFTHYIVAPRTAAEAGQVFKKYGFGFSGAIPYGVLMDAEGAIVAETKDGRWDQMMEAIKGL